AGHRASLVRSDTAHPASAHRPGPSPERMWMATESSRPRRLAAVCAAGMLAVGPALVAGPAFADTPTVAFSGGSVVGMLVCRSQPSAGQVTVAPESRVLFVNRLGQPATLRVGAQVVAKVGANQAVPVVFHYGPGTGLHGDPVQ